jgi:hypothetical protein
VNFYPLFVAAGENFKNSIYSINEILLADLAILMGSKEKVHSTIWIPQEAPGRVRFAQKQNDKGQIFLF